MGDDKVEQVSGIIGDPSSWNVAEQTGELVLVELRPGAFIKMRKSEAIAKGLWKEKDEERRAAGTRSEEQKALPPVKNKMRRQVKNKGQ